MQYSYTAYNLDDGIVQGKVDSLVKTPRPPGAMGE